MKTSTISQILQKLRFLACALLLGAATLSAQTQLGADIDGEASADESGFSVSLSSDGQTVAIGAPLNGGKGQVRVYKLISGMWTQQGADINGEALFEYLGWSVSLSSDGLTVAIGAYGNDGNGSNSGRVRVYKLISGTWTQQGADINGEAAGDESGTSVSLSSDGLTVAIGAPQNGGNGASSGHVRVYKLISGTWTQQGTDINGEAAGDKSGTSVSLSSDGLTVAIGAKWNDGNGSNSGHVRVFKFISGTWTQQGADINGETAGDESGFSVSLSSDGLTVAIGAPVNHDNGPLSGHVRVYKLISGAWTQQCADINGEATGDVSGESVSLSSDGLTGAIGAKWNDGNDTNSGHVRVYQTFVTCPATGSVWYVDAAAASGGTGSSWGCAFQNLQDAINAASNGHEIWVKAGTHKPTKDPFGNANPADPRDKTFYLKNGVAIYGGFAGTETARSQRNWSSNPTILSGDIGTANVNSDNCYHVALSVSDANTTLLDGFNIEKGNANGTGSLTVETKTVPRNQGGGAFNAASAVQIANCKVSANSASASGAGMFNGQQ